MAALVATLGSTLGNVALGLLTSLVTERFIKRLAVILLSKLVNYTASDMDNRILEEAKKSWGLDDKGKDV